MIYFNSDYMVGAHPDVLRSLIETNGLHTTGYGSDPFTTEAKHTILEACGLDGDNGNPLGEVFFLEGGTQTNLIVIARMLDHCDGVICADTAHINVHEAGAIEATGHKVIALPSVVGKINAEQVKNYVDQYYNDETYPHMVRPAMVYISYPTEVGTLYSRRELTALAEVCREKQISLYLDGARLAYGLASPASELSLKDIAEICDVFYIGGTKCGALFGEAVVTRRPQLLPRFFSFIKQHGALMAKGRLLGVQFNTLFSNNLYFEIGQHAIETAMRLKKGVKAKGYRLYMDSQTNQQFVILPNDKIAELQREVSFELWGAPGVEKTPVRFVTDWSTRIEDVDRLIELL